MISPDELPSRNFQPLRYGVGAWTEHIFFAYDLVAQSQPALLVELGSDRGESYFAFCQSVRENHTGTRCFAIDHWLGDPHAGSYESTTYDKVSAHNASHYSDFSTLLRESFDEALARFAPERIDLLHIDGHHTEEAVRHDVTGWLPKLRPGGILLMHDITVRERDFGVWKVWEEIALTGRTFISSDPPGLGLWEKPGGREQSPFLETLLGSPNEIRSYYKERNRQLQEMMARQWEDGSIRSSPMAEETVIQIFWAKEGQYCEKRSAVTRIGNGDWKDVRLPLPIDGTTTGLRIDFFSALTRVEIESITVETDSGRTIHHGASPQEFDLISLGGDCVRLSLLPFTIQVTGIDPQLYLPKLEPPVTGRALTARLRLRVLAP